MWYNVVLYHFFGFDTSQQVRGVVDATGGHPPAACYPKQLTTNDTIVAIMLDRMNMLGAFRSSPGDFVAAIDKVSKEDVKDKLHGFLHSSTITSCSLQTVGDLLEKAQKHTQIRKLPDKIIMSWAQQIFPSRIFFGARSDDNDGIHKQYWEVIHELLQVAYVECKY